jgi:hypothetical protein
MRRGDGQSTEPAAPGRTLAVCDGQSLYGSVTHAGPGPESVRDRPDAMRTMHAVTSQCRRDARGLRVAHRCIYVARLANAPS